MDDSASSKQPSKLATALISSFLKEKQPGGGKKLTVNPVVSRVASWYERFRNAMEYHEEEVVLRTTIERVLKRRLMLGGNAQTTAEPLVRELLWARYLPEQEVPESIVKEVEQSISVFLKLRFKILQKHALKEDTVNEWTYHLLSSDIENIVSPTHEKETMSNFMFQILKKHVSILDDSEQTRDVQVFIAVRRAFDRDDIAFLRYYLFTQYFGKLTEENLDKIASGFMDGYHEIQRALHYKLKDRIYVYVRRKAAVFLILEDILSLHKKDIKKLTENEEELSKAVFEACDKRYKSIKKKVRTAIIRSVAFILLTKVIFAFAIEGSYEQLVYGKVVWNSIIVNTGIPPVLMIIVGLLLRTPGLDNSKRILSHIQTLLYTDDPQLGDYLAIKKREPKNTLLSFVFGILWFLAFIVTFGGVVFILTKLHFNFVSQGVFIFFLAIVSFLAYRISLTAHLYTVGDRQGIFTPIIDFFFVPIIRVGRHLTEGISQINILIYIFDLFIEMPFKVLFGFLEQLFGFLHSKREGLD